MNFNLDVVPHDLESAVKILRDGFSPEEVRYIKQNQTDPCQLHHTIGRNLRNEWSLWDNDSVLRVWFRENKELNHADDVADFILQCLFADIKGQPREMEKWTMVYQKHWLDTIGKIMP